MHAISKIQEDIQFVTVSIEDAYSEFELDLKARHLAKATRAFYAYTAKRFATWLQAQGVYDVDRVCEHHTRKFLAELEDLEATNCKREPLGHKVSDWTAHGYARAVRTLIRFWQKERYIFESFDVKVPKMPQKRLPVPSQEEVKKLIAACKNIRDKAIIMFTGDTGLRRAEIVALNWRDINFDTGLVRVDRGKGAKPRSAVCSAATRRVLMKYRRALSNCTPAAPLFQNRAGKRFTNDGFALVFRRIGNRAGIKITPHMLRRFFVISALRSGMDVLHLQSLLGHADLSMVQHYAQMVDDDLIMAHAAHSPIENL